MKLRHLVLPLIAFSISAAGGSARDAQAQGATADPEKLQFAAEEFDSGRRAYKLGDFARAASHFENANRDAPSSQALRMAIRSRDEAGHHARAATLCVIALSMYADDTETVQLARRVLEQRGPQLYKVTVECEPACSLSLDGRLVRDDASTRQVIFTSEGAHTLVAGWPGNRSLSKAVEGTGGGSTVLSFEAPVVKQEPVAAGPPAASEPVVVESSSGKASPTLFWLGAGAVALFGGATIWSGIDTLNNPGPEKVKEACVGQGTSCPEYQDGLDKQARTNYLLLSTGVGVASVTVIGLFFTDWGGDDAPVDRATAIGILPVADPVRGQVGVAASGRF
jgi:hypothetical protein